ncbi:MAG TPA: glycosyltransferase family 4 protein [Chitinophagaceae bacterium]|nr:glycosyltransferase family 4 protein [Chitinophagaceae bacterium]
MKILHITQNYFPSRGGSQYMIQKISEYLKKTYNDDVTVITTNSYYGPHRREFKKIPQGNEIINGITVKRFGFMSAHKVPFKILGKLTKKIFGAALQDFFTNIQYGPISRTMRSAIIKEPCDVICASTVHYSFADYPLWRKKISRPKPFVMFGALHLHNNAISKSYKKRIIAADYYIANTQYEKDYLITEGIDAEKIKVIGTATDILDNTGNLKPPAELRLKYKIAAEKKIITFIGRQEISKSIKTLIDAFFDLEKRLSNIQLVIAGAEGTYSAQLEAIVAGHKKILLQKNISDEQKAEILSITDVLVLPSVEESFGIVFIEAWAFKKSVIGANIGAIASLISQGEDGLLFSPGNHLDLSKKIEALISSDSLRYNMGEHGHKKFLENYTWDIVANRFRQVYESAIIKYGKKSSA